jgi:hypothetical protein
MCRRDAAVCNADEKSKAVGELYQVVVDASPSASLCFEFCSRRLRQLVGHLAPLPVRVEKTRGEGRCKFGQGLSRFRLHV